MLVWETDPSLRDNELGAAFADVWCAIPKVVFSRTLEGVAGIARLAEASVAEEAAAALDATDKDVAIGGAGRGRGSDRARPRRRAAYVPQSDRRRWRHAVPAAGHRRRPLDLIETSTFGSRVIYERYGRARDESGWDRRPSRERLPRPGVFAALIDPRRACRGR